MAATRTNLRNSTSSTQASNNPASNHNLQQQQPQQQPQFNVSDNQYFYEDLVYRVDKKGNVEFGIVMGNDDQDMSEDSSSNEDSPKRKKGEIRVVWHPSGVEELINSKKLMFQVHLADRTLMPGDVVRRMIKGKDTQRGYCRDIDLTASVQVIGTKQVLTNIKSEDLVPLEEFAADIAVCMDSWVGGIRMVHYKLWLVTPDGSRCIVNEMNAQRLDQEEKPDRDNDFPRTSEFYPGQHLWGPVQCLEDALWLQCTKEMKTRRKSKMQRVTKFVVEKVETDWVGVHWQCRAYSKDGICSDQAHPKFVVEGEDLKKLKLLNIFEPSTLQVGDRNFYVIKGDENVITREQWRKQQREIFQVPKQSPKKTRNINMSKESVEEKIKRERDKSLETQKDNSKDSSKDSAKDSANASSEVNNVSETCEKKVSNENVSSNHLQVPVVHRNPESSDDWESTDTCSQSDSASISSGCSSLSSMGKKKKGPTLVTKVLKKRKLYRAKKKIPPPPLVAGAKIVVETLSTTTKATVVWQDGSVETDIPSTQLYPIHHLDDKEFFPGDFVVDQKEESRMYGVVQSVDHQGRTAKIKWFTTYTSSQSPTPTFLEEREVSVYDLKDHPDFQYRPGTVVIRIANFEGEDSGCTAGQVLDNFPEGRVKVWWVDGHVSMCWPQDLYKIGEYDSDEGELWDDASSEASWETELEDSCVADSSVGDNNGGGGGNNKLNPDNIKPKLAAHIEKARIAMSRLEEIFTQNPALQTTEVMRKLLEVYKDCRYMDKLMGTSFFHESHFQGLLERVRERGRANVAQRMAEQVNRLFTQSENASENDVDLVGVKPIDASKSGDDSFEKSGLDEVNVIFTEDESLIISDENQSDPAVAEQNSNQLFVSINRNPEDSGLYSAEMSKKESSSSDTSGEFILSEDTNNMDRSPAQSEGSKTSPLPENHLSTPHVCVKLCNLIKAQLVLAHAEVSKRFDLPKISLSDAAKTVIASNASNISITSNTGKKVKKAEDKKIEFLSEPSETSLEEIPAPVYPEGEGFSIDETAPDSHKFKLTMFQPTDRANFFRTVSKELKLLKSSLPPGIWVKGFEDRMDLYSVMMRGPEKTPYEDGLFLFDFQLSVDYPSAPPLCHYISYCSDRLNPNLYEDGKVCVSLLGTWAGRGTEVWTSSSTLLQVIVSIQGLILVAEPYFNEAGFEKQKGSQQGRENSRMYNEMVVLMLVQSQTKLIQYPPPVFKDAIIQHFEKHAEKLLKRLELWMEISEQYNNQHPLSPVTPTTFKETSPFDKQILPEFPLIPASKGFCITLKNTLANFKRTLIREGIIKLPLETSMTQSATDETSLNESPKGRKSFPTDGISGTSTPERVVVCSANNQGNRNSSAAVVELNESTTKRDSIERNSS
ncbi:(E3-independent) E2 ubiquitin-conjugating enzyme UBE2O [Trichogramma pretiosum]|uniref:(E3-independent) E2 ubiquitin-conjugating enzyme UBE2O n=1 Tax=Trichogramma pretiosum TaxID=7493 RepID=UPI0006C9AF51|nr:(E3-independent) E2 ubiquitin-conjugating enzyme UBE2O [Trichogramma pretiosum]